MSPDGGRKTRGAASAVQKLTPMLRQYLRWKREFPDALLFFRLGDFYELFFEDAERAAELLDLALTTRNRNEENPVPMCGVPYHAAQPYIARLLAAGLKVAICEQVEDPSEAKGLVAREVVRVVTPGTVTEEECLDPKRPNYLAALFREGDEWSLALVDVSTGETRHTCGEGEARLRDELARCLPAELLVPEGETPCVPGPWVSTVLAREFFDETRGGGWLAEKGIERVGPGTRAAFGAVLRYLERTHRAGLSHLRAPVDEGRGVLRVDEATQKNLELLRTGRGEFRGSLLWVLDRTETPMGGRLLRRWLLAPLVDAGAIGARLDAVEFALERPGWREEIRETLRGLGDLERLSGRLASGRVVPRDLLGLAGSLERIETLAGHLAAAEPLPPLLAACRSRLDALPELRARIRAALSEEPGETIRTGYHAEVDELRELARSGKARIGELEAAERKRTGIASLKIRYNQVFGYTIEVTKPNLHLVPPDYRRKQTLAGAERFVTPVLEEYERKVLGAEQKLLALERELFGELVASAARHEREIAASAAALAELDVLLGLAAVAEARRYVRPQLVEERVVEIRDGRHPVVEAVLPPGAFVPNDCRLDPEERQIVVVTGPNMAGKSTYLRQVALTVLLAQMGSFVPASEARIGVVDRLFTRVGASDNLAAGESTFMVEMRETATILSELGERSLAILDEIGRGTSTFDGISIAWAVAEFLHDSPKRPLVLFATHYHELVELARHKPRIRNASVAVKEWKGDVVFLHRIVDGPANRSYGIEVARLAGVPSAVVERAREVLARLEREGTSRTAPPRQLALFDGRAEELRENLARLDVTKLTPLEALLRLEELSRRARGET
ncbi:MAG: DNA mismatch repair protein MutS [Candidatus Binatia bacterium]|nr:MAG: DNA mismatch repair protein MutS [Candidatus Binatia bacterium]